MRRYTSLILTLALTTLLFSGCIGDNKENHTNNRSGNPLLPDLPIAQDTTQPALGNHRLTMHSDGDRLWMDTDATATTTSISDVTLSNINEARYAFPLQPAPSMDIQLGDQPARVHVSSDFEYGGINPDTIARILVDGKEVGKTITDATGSLHIDVPLSIGTIPAGADVVLEICICPKQTTLFNSYTLNTDGRTWMDLPILAPLAAGYEPPTEEKPATRDRTPDRREGNVQVERQGDRWVAKQTITISNAIGNAETIDTDLLTGNGGVAVASVDGNQYTLRANLVGRGDTEQEARDNLASLNVHHEDTLTGTHIDLATTVQPLGGTWNNRGAGLGLDVPASLFVNNLHGDTSNGGMAAASLRGQTLTFDTSNGGIAMADLKFDKVKVSTSNGGIALDDVTLGDLDARTSNGGIAAVVDGSRTGNYNLRTSNGGIALVVPDGNTYGYDAEAETTNSRATINLRDTEPVGEQENTHKHVRTTNYNDRDIKVKITAKTSNGEIEIEGN